ncbi:hypothetical protein QO206_06835 [Leeuwenhoekiella aequorea]|uniref:Uncharacterized protein n=1 Tax=Leeuwenhoekiella aequorea TaxID=283736 RepID=A0A4Q0P626_9FLAO|nr:hypothetical protein [Leeuwenhoekiella aequorea]RXG21099.1 hypothetical protein DSM00_2616 [Leeuwenhoekiella aequorea]|tara:strand:- start:2759 stop:2962 length:204 start_codon:yes stop_codon:yes gene_type:complete
MKRILLAGFALSLMITVASCREASEEKTEEVMEETSMEEVAPEAPVQEMEVEEVVNDTLQVETPAAE